MPPTLDERLARPDVDPTMAMILRAMAEAGSPGTAAVSRESLEAALGQPLPSSGPATLNDRLAMLASFFGNALPGRGGVGPPGRYPRGAQGLDITKEGGRARGAFRFQGMEAPQAFEVGAEAGSVPIPPMHPDAMPADWLVKEILPIIRDFAKTAPEGSGFKAISDWNAYRSLSRATQDSAAAKALSAFLDWLGAMPEARRQSQGAQRWISREAGNPGPVVPELGQTTLPYVLDPKTGRMRPRMHPER